MKIYKALILGITLPLLAQQNHTAELKKAIELAEKDKVAKLLEDVTFLPKDDKEFLVVHAEKWAAHRKTIISSGSQLGTSIGLKMMLIGAAPLSLYGNTFCRNLINKNLDHPAVVIPGIYSAFFLLYGGLIYYLTRKNNNMGCIEQRAHSIVALIKNIKIEDKS